MDRMALLELMNRSMVVKKGAVLGAAGGGAVSHMEQTDRAREFELQLVLVRRRSRRRRLDLRLRG